MMDTEDPNDFQAELLKYEAAAKRADKEADKKMAGAMSGMFKWVISVILSANEVQVNWVFVLKIKF